MSKVRSMDSYLQSMVWETQHNNPYTKTTRPENR